MKNATTYRRIAAMLAALLFCLLTAIGLAANSTVKAYAAYPDDPARVGLWAPNTNYYQNFAQKLEDEGYVVDPRYTAGVGVDAGAITGLASCSDILISVPGELDDNDLIKFGVALNEALIINPLIKLIVLGDYFNGAPAGTMFITGNYYQLGQQHAQWIYSDNLDSNDTTDVCIYFNQNEDNPMYLSGLRDGLEYYGISILAIYYVTSESDAMDKVQSMFSQHVMIDEIVTCSPRIAEIALEKAYALGCRDTSYGNGMGIRAFSYDSEDGDIGEQEMDEYSDEVLQNLNEVITAFLENEIPPYSEMIGECYVLYMDFAPGYAVYVDR